MDTIISMIHDGDDLVTKIAHEYELPHHAEVVYVEPEDELIPDLPKGVTALLVAHEGTRWEFWIDDVTQDFTLHGTAPQIPL